MIIFTANTRLASCQTDDAITSGSVGLECSFRFSKAWDSLQKVAIFQGSGQSIDVLLASDSCVVPHEVLVNARGHLKIGVYGTGDQGQKVTPTIWADAGPILPGAEPSEIDPTPATQSLVQQILEAAEGAAAIAQGVRDDADAGEFDGEKGETGSGIWLVNASYVFGQYAMAISNLEGRDDTTPAVDDLVIASDWNVYVIRGIYGSTVGCDLIGSIKGETGPQGPRGYTGNTGAAGVRGSLIWSTTALVEPGSGPSWAVPTSSLTGKSGATPLYGDLVIASEPGSSGATTYLYLIVEESSTVIMMNAIGSIKGATGPQGADGVGVPSGGATGQVLKKASGTDYDTEWADESGGGGVTSDYSDLTNKPQIAGVTLSGNKSLADFGIAAASDIPTVPVQSVNGQTGAVTLSIPSTAADVGAIAAPEGGSVGQVLKKTASGAEWADESGGGLSSAAKAALIQIAQKVVYIDGQSQTYFEDLRDALYTLNSISAVYTQGEIIYTNTPLNDLKAALVVTANYSDSYTEIVPDADYTLSGTLTAGTSTITVSYSGKITTFTVTVTQYRQPLYSWDFTQSLTDSIGGLTMTLANSNGGSSYPTQDSTGLHFTAGEQIAATPQIYAGLIDGKLYEFDISSAVFAGNTSKHKRLFNAGSDNLLIFRNAGQLQIYRGAWLTLTAEPGKTIPTTLDELSGKTVGIKLGTDKTFSLYIGGELIATRASWLPAGYAGNYTFRFGGNSSGTAADGNDIHNLTITGFRIYQEE